MRTMASLWPTPCLPSSSTDRKSTRLNSSHGYISYAVFCLKKKIRIEHVVDMVHLLELFVGDVSLCDQEVDEPLIARAYLFDLVLHLCTPVTKLASQLLQLN